MCSNESGIDSSRIFIVSPTCQFKTGLAFGR